MAEKNEIVLINKSQGRFTLNFQGAFQNKTAVRDGKFYLTEKEYDYLKATYPHILEGDERRLYPEGEEPTYTGSGASGADENEAFFAQHHTKVKSAISKMELEEAEEKYKYAQLHEVSDAIIKALEDRILELDKSGE